jgi:hypothetical protein
MHCRRSATSIPHLAFHAEARRQVNNVVSDSPDSNDPDTPVKIQQIDTSFFAGFVSHPGINVPDVLYRENDSTKMRAAD